MAIGKGEKGTNIYQPVARTIENKTPQASQRKIQQQQFNKSSTKAILLLGETELQISIPKNQW